MQPKVIFLDCIFRPNSQNNLAFRTSSPAVLSFEIVELITKRGFCDDFHALPFICLNTEAVALFSFGFPSSSSTFPLSLNSAAVVLSCGSERTGVRIRPLSARDKSRVLRPDKSDGRRAIAGGFYIHIKN